jgi:siderophore synthetase component
MGSTENTPRVSQLLTDIFAQEKCFSDRLYLLRGLYGLHLKQVTPEQGKHLSVIFRENIHLYLAADEIGVVIAGLFSISPISGLSLFVEQLEAAGATTLKSALDYFKYYVNLLLTSYLDLYLIYGITLEGHQQNTLAVFHHGKITRFVARDFADTDIHLPTLKRRGFDIKPYPGSAYITDDLDQVRKPLIHAVYRLHLGGLVLLLAKHFNCNEDYFWKIIRDITIERFEFVKNKMDTATWQTEYHAILQDDWLGKALLSMRLEKEGAPMGVSFEMDNPLKKLERK